MPNIAIKDIHIKDRHRKNLGDIQALADSLAEVGLLHPIVITPDCHLVAGARRLAAAKFLHWEKIPATVVHNLTDAVKEIHAERDENVCRKDLVKSESVALAKTLLPLEREEAFTRQVESRANRSENFTPRSKTEKGNFMDRVAKAVGMSRPTLEHAMAVVDAAEEEPGRYAPFVAEMDKTGKVDGVYKKLKKKKVKEERLKQAEKTVPSDLGIIVGEFQVVGAKVLDNSVDLIFTDPPYDEKSIPLYGELAKFGARVLKPGGSLICYAGHYALPEIFQLMMPHLRFWWTLACEHSGASARLPGKWVFVGWKPMLWFVKEGRSTNEYISDIVHSQPSDKENHEWEQAIADAEYYIEHLTSPGDTICDPMCGGGTTCIAAIRLNRQYIAIEKNPESAMIIRMRINDEYKPK